MAILVTGGAGYIGSITVELLHAQGMDVVVLDNLLHGHRAAVGPAIPFYLGDIDDSTIIERIVREHKIDACIHFAALATVGDSVSAPADYFRNNVVGGISLLDSLLKAGAHKIVFSSTCAVYGEPQRIPITEDHPQLPANPYGWSKLFMERIMETYDRAYGLRYVALRYFNAAGASIEHGEHHDPETHLIPNVLDVAVGRVPYLSVYGDDYPTPDGTAVRDYISVEDLGAAHILALKHLASGGASNYFNLGTGHGYSVREVIDTAERVTGRKIEYKIAPRRAGDPSHLVAGAGKAETTLGWKCGRSDLASIIDSAWQWKLNYPNGYALTDSVVPKNRASEL